MSDVENSCGGEEMVLPMTPPATQIISVRNHIYLYDEIDKAIARSFISGLMQMSIQMVEDCIENGYSFSPIWVHINSYGGNVNDGLAIIQAIEELKSGSFTEVNEIKIPLIIGTKIEGEADSMASLIACSGSNGYRHISKDSLSLLHEPRQLGGIGGKVEDIDDQKENLDLFRSKLKNIYLRNSKLTEEKLKEVWGNEKYSTPEELLEYGLVDKIV